MEEAAATPKKTPGRKKGATVNKTQEIRSLAREMIDDGKRPRPAEIVEKLENKGIKVSGPQVSLALKGSSLALRRGTVGTSNRIYLPDPIEALRRSRLEDLGPAKEFIRLMGGIERAITAIVAASHIGPPENHPPAGRSPNTPTQRKT